MSHEAIAWARKWYADGVQPKKEPDANGRMVLPERFKMLPVTPAKLYADDVMMVVAK